MDKSCKSEIEQDMRTRAELPAARSGAGRRVTAASGAKAHEETLNIAMVTYAVTEPCQFSVQCLLHT